MQLIKKRSKLIYYLIILCIAVFFAIFLLSLLSQCSAKIVRVGTTGDYPPLTYFNSQKKQYEGLDIELIRQIGRYNGWHIKFVKTSWPTLNKDLLAKKFDIAVGGITRNADRQKLFLVSLPIMSNGKVPLVLCKNLQRFSTADAINKPSVRIVENRGGTNETYTKQNFKNANIIVCDNNQQPFAKLLANQAGVMITDLIEAQYRQKLNAQFCIVKPQHPFTTSVKVYLIAKDQPELLRKIDKTIIKLTSNSKLAQLKSKWLGS